MATVVRQVLCSATFKFRSYGKEKLTDKEKIKQLEQRLKDAEQQLKYEKLKREGNETMIDIAQEELNIQIRKKPGAGHPAPNNPKNETKTSSGLN